MAEKIMPEVIAAVRQKTTFFDKKIRNAPDFLPADGGLRIFMVRLEYGK